MKKTRLPKSHTKFAWSLAGAMLLCFTLFSLGLHAQSIAVCDEITDVSLNSGGHTNVFAETFDDGSYSVICNIQNYEVRRMTDNCDVSGFGNFGPTVTFCCEDIANNPIMVEFRVRDCTGAVSGSCMVEVNVQDKLFPVAQNCPPNERILCDWYADNLQIELNSAADDEAQNEILNGYFGVANFFDNCEPIIESNVNINLDQCLEGTITRSYSVSDPSGNTINNQCNQIIFVDHVSDWVVEFPANLTVNCGTTVPEFGEPEIFFETCELVAISFEDEVFTVVPDACFKVLRTWVVINWCVVGGEIDEEFEEDAENAIGLSFPNCDLDGDGDCDDRTFRDSWASGTYVDESDATSNLGPDTDSDSDPWDGYITYQQTIKVIDEVDPVFANGCVIPDVCIEDNTCAATVVFPIPDVDECSYDVTFEIEGDLGAGIDSVLNVSPGTYEVIYTAIDNCNNQTACETTVTVMDCKAPTPYCKNGLIVELMSVEPPMVEVWATDFDAGSFDNCPGVLKFSFSNNVNDIGATFTCDEVGQNMIELWVTDLAGNQDYCETFVIIQNNPTGFLCEPDDPIISGLIMTEEAAAVAEVEVQVTGTNEMSEMTDTLGVYDFFVQEGGNYMVSPEKNSEPLNGVTTFDIILINRHILGIAPLDSPYKMIAADANNSKSITTADVLELRKLILFIQDEFQNNTSWRFVEEEYVFPNPNNPWEEFFPEHVSISSMSGDEILADFTAVKIGDVNNSVSLLTSDSPDDRNENGALIFNIENVSLKKGELYQVDFKVEDFAVLGYQFTLNFDTEALEFVEAIDAVAGEESFGFNLLEEGAITTSWNKRNINFDDEEIIFSLVFDVKESVRLSEVLSLNSRFTKAEAYQPNGDLLDIELQFNIQPVSNFELYQNTPNPFNNQTAIGFNLPKATTINLTITDLSGRIIKTVKGDFSEGYNEIKLERRDLPATGMIYYQLDTNTDSATRMMLLVD